MTSHVPKSVKRHGARKRIRPIRDNSLTIVLFVFFILCLVAQSFAGWRFQNETLVAHGHAPIDYWNNLSSGIFLEGLAVNWQAAFLQLASLIWFSSFLYQRGAPHSRDLVKVKNNQKDLEEARRFTWGYRNSLFLVFLALFVLSFALHVVFGSRAYNEERAFTGQSPVSVVDFLLSAKFWSSILQTWQAEYLAIALFVVLSVFLRQRGSAESKPVESKNKTTGKANK